MGLIAAALNAAGGTLASQWKEYFYVDALPDNVLVARVCLKNNIKQKIMQAKHEQPPKRQNHRSAWPTYQSA